MGVTDRLVRKLRPPPVEARHAEYSMLFSADDEQSPPSSHLISVALDAVRHAQQVDLSEVTSRIQAGPKFTEVWPGEHYKLLAGLLLALKPEVVIEIGTSSGLSALAMKKYLPEGGKLATFDLIPWQSFPSCHLHQGDFADGRLVQFTDDLTQPEAVRKHESLLRRASFIFIDAAKDGRMEREFIENLRQVPFEKTPIVMFDDIRVWNMLRIWREISMPKLDVTSFGHWSGSGLIELRRS